MKKLIACIRAFISSPKRDLKQLVIFEKELEAIKNTQNKVEIIVKLFQVTSLIQGQNYFGNLIEKLNKKNYGQLDEAVKSTRDIQINLVEIEIDRHKISNTKEGGPICNSNIFLGNIYGLWPFSVAYWLQEQDKLISDAEYGARTWHIIHGQAASFIEGNTNRILKNISIIKNAVL